MSSSHSKDLSLFNSNNNNNNNNNNNIGHAYSFESLTHNPYAHPSTLNKPKLPPQHFVAPSWKKKKKENKLEKERREGRKRRLSRFTKKANRNRNTYFNKNSAQTIQRVWRGSKTRKSNNLHQMYSKKAKEYNNISQSRRNNVASAQQEKRQALKYKEKGYGYGQGKRNPAMEHYNNTTIAYADGLKIDAARSQELLNKKRNAIKKLATKQKYSRYRTPAERAAAREAYIRFLATINRNNANKSSKNAYYEQHGSPTYVKHSPGSYEEEGETYSTYGWGGRRKTRRKHKRKSRKKKKRKKKSHKRKLK